MLVVGLTAVYDLILHVVLDRVFSGLPGTEGELLAVLCSVVALIVSLVLAELTVRRLRKKD